MKCWVIKGQRDTKIQPKREREGDRKTMRKEEKSFRGGRREKEVDPDWVCPFFFHWFETDLHHVCSPSHRQWDITLCSGSRGSDSNWMSITHCDWPWAAPRRCLNHPLCRSEFRSYRLCALNCNKQSGNQVAVSSWCQGRQIDPSDGVKGDTGPSQLSASHLLCINPQDVATC